MNIVAGDHYGETVLVLGTLVVIVAAVVGLASGRGLRPALWTGLALSVVMIGLTTLGSVVTGQYMGDPGVNLVPFEEIQRGLRHRGTSSWTNVVGNIALFVPLGFAIACLARRGFWLRWLFAAGCGLALSTAIEITQFAFGRVADVDDVILNTTGALAGGFVGALIGVMLFHSTSKTSPTPAAT